MIQSEQGVINQWIKRTCVPRGPHMLETGAREILKSNERSRTDTGKRKPEKRNRTTRRGIDRAESNY